jgi:hypothetical protein
MPLLVLVCTPRVGLVYKSGVRPSKPFLPFPPVFQANEAFRQWMLTKRTSDLSLSLSSSMQHVVMMSPI